MKRTALACLALLPIAVLGPVPAAAGAPAPRDPFAGAWAATDIDGSAVTLSVNGAGSAARHAVTEFDDSASVCGGVPAFVAGAGVVYSDVMWVTWTVSCRPGGNPFRGPVDEVFSHDAASDTLTDSFGVVYHRTTG